MSPAQAALLQGLLQIKAVQWKSLSTSPRVDYITFGFSDCMIIDCVFDKASCQDWRIRGTTFGDTSFRAADLPILVVGWGFAYNVKVSKHHRFQPGRPARDTKLLDDWSSWVAAFSRIRSSKASSSTEPASPTAVSRRREHCERFRFTNCPDLVKGIIPPNEMLRSGFQSGPTARFVEFRNLNLEHVTYPQDSDHIVLDPYLTILDRSSRVVRAPIRTQRRKCCTSFSGSLEYAGTGP